MRAGVQQIFALDVDLRAAVRFAEALGVIERRGTAGVIGQQILQLGLKRGIEARFQIRLLQFFERRHQNFRDVAAAVGAEVTAGIGVRGWGLGVGDSNIESTVERGWINRRILS